ncbi:TPR Domain containing protein [Metarhizium guizhouense ARSEF 977]|uniref:TPR Domain containing protein n=1 Tax=Metarhizium guizhouense (strain ARSEF 977) TaxID=1276136 RepID=A0A0B4GF99_METGA|nr:TPR Domain containing protein [Metarhizium guizhouense ARSEF 977]
MVFSINEKFALYESCPSEKALREIIQDLGDLAVSERVASTLNKLGYCLFQLFSYSSEDADLDRSISVLKEALSLAGDNTAVKLKALMNIGDAFQRRWELHNSVEDLTEYVSSRRSAVQVTPILDRSIADKLMDLADALSAKYDKLSLESDLVEATHVQRLAMLVLQDGPLSPDQNNGISFLASLLEDQFWKSGTWHALDESVLWKAKLASSPNFQGLEDFQNYARDLSICLLDRYGLYHLPEDLQNAISWAKQAVSHLSSTDKNYSKTAYQLAVSLQKEWDRTEKLDVLDDEIHWYEESLRSLKSGTALSNHRHNLLGVALCQRAHISKSAKDIESAADHVMVTRNKSEVGSDEHVRSLNNISNVYESAVTIKCSLTRTAVSDAVETAQLALSLKPDSELVLYNFCKAKALQYEKTGIQDALNKCLELARKLCQAKPSPRNLGLLEIALIHTFHATGTVEVLDEAIAAGLKSIRPALTDSSDDSKRLTTLGNVLGLRAEWKGTVEDCRRDISDSIEYLQHSSRIIATKPGGKPAGYDANLAYALLIRYDILAAESDLDEAICLFKAAISTAESNESDSLSAQHSNIAAAYMKKYCSTKEKDDINSAIHHGEKALEFASELDPRLPVRCNNLAVSLQCKFSAGFDSPSQLTNITRAIELFEKASILAGKGSAAHPGYLNNLGLARLSSVKLLGDLDETGVQKTIDDFSKALSLVEDKGPLSGGILLNLAQAWRMKYEQDGLKKEVDLRAAIGYAERAVNTPLASLTTRIKAGYMGGIWITQIRRDNEDRQRAAQMLGVAASLFPLLSPRDMTLRDEMRNLSELNALNVTADAVAAGLDAGFCILYTLQNLETGRGVIVGNLLECRSDLTILNSDHPSLAKRFEELREAYHQADQLATSMSLKPLGFTERAPATDAMDRYHLRLSRVEEKIRSLLVEIRSHDAFKEFLVPSPSTDLSLTGFGDGYIVAINASQIRCDAFLIHEGQATLVPLADLDYEELCYRDEDFIDALNNQSSDPKTARRELIELLGWLWKVCGKPIVDMIVVKKPARAPKPRVWWMLGGVLGRLPLHACGNYHKDSLGRYECLECMASFVVSSYIPTLKSFQYAREQAVKFHSDTKVGKAMVVAVSQVGIEGEVKLQSAETEAEEIRGLLGEDGASQVMLNPCFADVIKALPTSPIAHFACHGVPDRDDPSHTYLKLPDFEANPLSVHVLMGLMIRCGFVYLSACDTAASRHRGLIDESLHLVNGFLLAGCPQVVGTLWKIPDEQASQVVAHFYSRLPWREGRRDPEAAALALHDVISGLGSLETGDPLVLAAFVHYGV